MRSSQDGYRHYGIDGQRHRRQLRHHDQAAPRRSQARVTACWRRSLRHPAAQPTRKAIEVGFGFFTKSCIQERRLMKSRLKNWAILCAAERRHSHKPYPCGGLTHQVIDQRSSLEQSTDYRRMVEPSMSASSNIPLSELSFACRKPASRKILHELFGRPGIIDGKSAWICLPTSAVRDQATSLNSPSESRCRLDPQLEETNAAGRPCRVTIRLKSGQSYSREAQHAKGGPRFPMTEAELKAKFLGCARHAINEKSAERALGDIERLETLSDIRPLCDILRG